MNACDMNAWTIGRLLYYVGPRLLGESPHLLFVKSGNLLQLILHMNSSKNVIICLHIVLISDYT